MTSCAATTTIREALRTCTKCGETKPLDAFWRATKATGGRSWHCIECQKKRQRQYRIENQEKYLAAQRARTEADPERKRAEYRRWYAKHPNTMREHRKAHPEKEAARLQVSYAVKRGELVRPDGCSECGSTKRVQAHHDDYSKPLEVMWLCQRCHARRHRTLTAAAVAAVGPGQETDEAEIDLQPSPEGHGDATSPGHYPDAAVGPGEERQ